MDRRVPTRLARSVGACLPVLALLIATGMGNASAAPVPVNARAAALAALKHLMIGEHGTDHAASGQTVLGGFGPKKVTSGNWSGYADDSGRSYTTVTAQWEEPAVTCPPQGDTMAAFWVGIDGYSSSTVEQDGTLIESYEGTVYYYDWWEIYPETDVQVVDNVSPGDHITSTVTRSGNSYTLSVTDSTHTADSFSTTQTYAGAADSSAEWIAEAPSGSSGVEPLTDFGTVNFSGASTTEGSTTGSISSFTDDEITMITSSGATEATPSSLTGSGSAFSVTWDRS